MGLISGCRGGGTTDSWNGAAGQPRRWEIAPHGGPLGHTCCHPVPTASQTSAHSILTVCPNYPLTYAGSHRLSNKLPDVKLHTASRSHALHVAPTLCTVQPLSSSARGGVGASPAPPLCVSRPQTLWCHQTFHSHLVFVCLVFIPSSTEMLTISPLLCDFHASCLLPATTCPPQDWPVT